MNRSDWNRIRNFCTRLILGLLVLSGVTHARENTVTSPKVDSRRAYGYLVEICKIGPRVSGSTGMAEQQRLMIQHFQKLGGRVSLQGFDAPHPLSGNPVRMNNFIVTWHPERKQRILLCCHYDTRPFPDQDPVNPRGRFVGANDGASGVALFMEMAHHIKELKSLYGIDMVCFDGEELVYQRGDKYFLGSEYFATQYRDNPPKHEYKYGVLVDMVAGKGMRFYYEKNSLKHAPQVVKSVWESAAKLRNRAFIRRAKHEVLDDHIPLNEIAKIPTCDLIDFDYRYWHTTGDAPQNCSASNLGSVAEVLLHWLQTTPGLQPENESN